mgnify:CR=1 FL=1
MPKGYRIEAPGDLVQVDTLQARILPNQSLDLLTPDDHYRRWKKNQKARVSRMS